ncbi:hypothetical protein BDW72DRAFT_185399 [Aspergillus terricola var. indicus]
MQSFFCFKPFPILAFLILLSSPVLSSYSPQLEIFYWPVANPEPSALAHVSYDPASLKSELIDYSPPINLFHELARVGFYITTPTNPKQWVGTLIPPSALTGADSSQKPTLRLHVSPTNEIYHVSIGSTAVSSSSSSKSIEIELIADDLGPSPLLNRPIVVGPDGKNSEEQPEKTLFQKYWWVFLIVTLLAMSGGGEQQ